MEDLPLYISLTFIALTAGCVAMFYFASRKHTPLLLVVIALAAIQAALASTGFFTDTQSFPPRLLYIIAPGVLLMILAFSTEKGKRIIDRFDLKTYTWLHSVRIIVEIVLLWLFIHELLPQSMTFEGRNFDILSGLTAPLIVWLGFKKNKINKPLVLIWNVICLILVLQVVMTGVFSAPSPFQKLAFDQPNVAVLYFPFIWLPGIVVPIVIFGHLVAIRRLMKKESVPVVSPVAKA